MDYFPGNWGNPRTRDAELLSSNDYFPGKYAGDMKTTSQSTPVSHTQQPIVTGTSVIGIRYNGGVILAADNLASYGSLARFRDVERLSAVGPYSVVGVSGDISDFQHLKLLIEQEEVKEFYNDDGHHLAPPHVHEWLIRLLYQRRTQMNPLWNSVVVAGFKDNTPYLGYVDYQGTSYQSPTIATGFGGHLAQPLLRKAYEAKQDLLTEQEALKIVEDCMRVLYYRDARSMNKIQVAIVNKDGVKISKPYSLSTEWGFAEFIRGYGA